MPEQQISVYKALECLEDNTFTEILSRNQYLEVIQKALQSNETLSVQTIDRILAICIQDLKGGVKQSSVLCLHTIATVLKRVQNGTSTPNLLPSAEAVLHTLKTSALFPKAEALQTMCFNTLLDYPNDVLITLAVESGEFWEILNVYCSQKVSVDIRFQPINITLRVLKTLSPDKKSTFVKKGLDIWFSKIVPCVMNYCQTVVMITPQLLTSLEVLEMLTEELIQMDYSNNPHWQAILDNIYNPKKYPATMKNLLVSGNEHWQRLWIIFIKLLEDQITMYRPGMGSPINSMLPVVETAFKLDVTNRCKAFQCWNVLIDVFSAEMNEQYVEKRIKLLLIPLKLNNAKVEETALAKLNTWWHLITQFEGRLNDAILYPFLHFCFGRLVNKAPIIPGLISPKMKENCVKAFVELVGHVNCEGCGLQERLKGKLISSKVLVNHWNDWVYSLKMAIQMSGTDDVELGIKPISCVWKSFVMTIAELPENNIRKDLFNELLVMIKQLAQENRSNKKLADILVNVLITSLFEEDSIKPLLKIKEIQNGPLWQLLTIIIAYVEEYRIVNKEQPSSTNHIKLVIEFMANECPHLLEETVGWLVNDFHSNDTTLELWTALAESFQIARPKEDYWIHMLLRWPINHMKMFTNAKEAAQAWASTFSLLNVTKEKITAIDEDITSILARSATSTLVASPLALCALLSIIKASLLWEVNCVHKIEMLLNLISKYTDYNQFDHSFPLLIDTINLWVSKLSQYEDLNLHSVACITKKILSILNKELKENDTIDNEKVSMAVNAIKPLFQTDTHVKVMNVLADELLACRTLCKSQSLHLSLDYILNLIASQKDTDQELRGKIKEAIEKPEVQKKSNGNVMESLKSVETSENEFTTPVPKSAKKNPKKKETNIVNTVVENGEEFAVIQSNWKFNPRKLTENQKEKLQRKREDIPALYQDLSQSQDEFKLKSWKPDSQDASTTNSRSASTTSNEDVSTALKNIPDTNIVPKIISNFFSESPKPDVVSNTNFADKIKNRDTCSPKSNKSDKANLSPSIKTPRMALKDRVSRNVKNLIEKSTVAKDGTPKPDLLNQTVTSNIFNTPVTECKEKKTGINSAPSKISGDRPARVKRTPKKFDDTELFLLKKRRNSNVQTDSQSSEINIDSEVTNAPSEIVKDPILKPNKITETVAEKDEPKIVEHEIEISDPVVQSQLITDEKNLDVQKAQSLDNQVAHVSSSTEKEAVVSNVNDPASISEEKPDEVISSASTSVDIQERSKVEKNNKNILKDNQVTPKLTPKRKDTNEIKSSTKKKSRIEKELAIDMVEGHPFLKMQSEKRVTRKCLSNTPNNSRRKSLTEKLNKSKIDNKNASKPKKETNNKDLSKEKSPAISTDLSVTVCETQELCAFGTQDLSEDIIESSQDSMTTISVKSFKNSTKKTTDTEKSEKTVVTVEETQNLIDNSTQEMNTYADVSMIQESKDDTEIPANKTDIDNVRKDLTEEMDTQPTDDKSSGEVILINDDEPIIVLNSEDTLPGPDTLEFANADTEPMNPSQFVDNTCVQIETSPNDTMPLNNALHKESNFEDTQLPCTANDRPVTLPDIIQNETINNASSPSRDDDQRKKDFLNNTLEISPIKPLSPIEPKSPSPETSSDFLIVKLSGPIQMNGEPLEISNSPEILTEEKSSPDKRDQSPPRLQVTENKSSPSSSLSLKKNRPQVRAGGRAAQMLGLCVPERAQTIMSIDRLEIDEPKKSNPVNTPVRRNLRMLYAPAADSENLDQNEDSENFLRFEKDLPPADCSPAGPILKRKLAEISDEATVSPANKRKRVSFHDPVSTSVSVQKYIETSGVRSPQSSALKRLERQIRNHSHMKSPKRLDNLFKLDSILVKTVESFTENDVSNNDTQLSSLEETPAVEIIKSSELNDTDPIFPDLIDCKDSIHNIASELSSPAMKLLLVKELEGNIETVGDMAKLTELEVNRLCIKAPKVQVVKKVLSDYLCKMDKMISKEKTFESALDKEATGVHVEVQTSILTSETETQTSLVLQRLSSTQTDSVMTLHRGAQTKESGSKPTEDIIKSCLQERIDFVPKLGEQLDVMSIRKLADCMSAKDCTDILVKNMTSSDAMIVFNQVLQRESELHHSEHSGNKELSFLLNYLSDKFDAKDLIWFCSQMLKKVHDKSI